MSKQEQHKEQQITIITIKRYIKGINKDMVMLNKYINKLNGFKNE